MVERYPINKRKFIMKHEVIPIRKFLIKRPLVLEYMGFSPMRICEEGSDGAYYVHGLGGFTIYLKEPASPQENIFGQLVYWVENREQEGRMQEKISETLGIENNKRSWM